MNNKQQFLEKMMKQSANSIIERSPNLGRTEIARYQVSIMDAFFAHVLPELNSLDDLKDFHQQYLKSRPCV